MEPLASLSSSQKPACLQPVESILLLHTHCTSKNHFYIILRSGLLSSDFLTRILYVFFPMRDTCSAFVIRLYLITLNFLCNVMLKRN
jgi:hypothetical protein